MSAVSADVKISEAVTVLAALRPLDYEVVREKEAEKLGVRVSALDDAVKGNAASVAVPGRCLCSRKLSLGPRPWTARNC